MQWLRKFQLKLIFISILISWAHLWKDEKSTCRTIPGLTRHQLELCYHASDVTRVALEGLEVSIKECQSQFKWHRWNCSSLSTKSRNPHSSNLFKRGYKETAFACAISAAGVVHSIARACGQGRLLSCGCDSNTNQKFMTKALKESLEREPIDHYGNSVFSTAAQKKHLSRSKVTSRWKWGGCSHNVDFGVKFSELFLDSREKAGDIQSKINLHNNNAGRMAVVNNMKIKCKCHGMSGSCQLKTCWKSASDFSVIGKVLKQQYRRSILVDQSNIGSGPIMIIKRNRNKLFSGSKRNRNPRRSTLDKIGHKHRRKLENSLLYFQRSPNFCERDISSDILGTSGRRCNVTSKNHDGCDSLCCGRGYTLIKEKRIEKCRCRFNWCCYVVCQECEIEEWISICN